METENKNEEPNMTRTLDGNTVSSMMNPGKPHRNGHCIFPNELSQNKVNKDISSIHTRVSMEENMRTDCFNCANSPGPSQGRDATCGLYYGIKSYLHHFYGPPDKEVLKSGEYAQGDDFRFLAEPQRRGCWVRAGLWVGINLMCLGIIALLVSYLTPPRQAVVGQFQEFTVLDRWAVNFNYQLMMCQLAGLITMSFGAVVVVCSLMVANCQASPPPPAYLVMGACLPTSGPAWGIHCIPLSGTIKSVQPQFIKTQY